MSWPGVIKPWEPGNLFPYNNMHFWSYFMCFSVDVYHILGPFLTHLHYFRAKKTLNIGAQITNTLTKAAKNYMPISKR